MKTPHWSCIFPALMICVFACTSQRTAPTLILTEAEHTPGERSLQLQGFFRDADTVLVQVYHDGKELYSEPHTTTWNIALSNHHYYVIKFTDQRQRVKRIYLVELSDNQVEFLPPIEVDFSVGGNVLYLKQRDGKLDWQEFDVGMSRQQRTEP